MYLWNNSLETVCEQQFTGIWNLFGTWISHSPFFGILNLCQAKYTAMFFEKAHYEAYVHKIQAEALYNVCIWKGWNSMDAWINVSIGKLKVSVSCTYVNINKCSNYLAPKYVCIVSLCTGRQQLLQHYLMKSSNIKGLRVWGQGMSRNIRTPEIFVPIEPIFRAHTWN